MATLRSLLGSPVNEQFLGELNELPAAREFIMQATCWQSRNENYQEYCCQAWIVPAGTSCATFEIWGGGGSGAGACCCMWGPPGGSGAFSRKTISVTPGDCYDLNLAMATDCSGGANTGIRGCKTWITGNGLSNFCAEGGWYGCSYCFPSCCFSWCTCGVANAYGGDVNIPGVRGCGWHICCNTVCWNRTAFPYPGGLVNECGGVTMVGGYTSWGYNSYETCISMSYTGFSHMAAQYMPGRGGNTSYVQGFCVNGTPGMPGLIRILYW